jgi:ABC-type multidrug transport system fused ATPase/permease subunit
MCHVQLLHMSIAMSVSLLVPALLALPQTIAALLTRMYEPDSGEILVGPQVSHEARV